jgi:transcriptional regulator of arginine metabolism
MNLKTHRLSVIADILRKEVICSQEDLQKSLKNRGIDATQATLSRDVRQMKIIKSPDSEGRYVYRLLDMATQNTRLPTKDAHPDSKKTPSSRKRPALNNKPTIDFSGSLAVIRTRPGYAMSIASDIDEYAPEEILGTIAGDDTIIVIPREEYSKTQILNALEEFLK